MALIEKPGVYPGIKPSDYFAEPCPVPALTNSGIDLLDPPARFYDRHPMLGGNAENVTQSAALRIGSVIHRLALGKGDEYAVSPYDDYRSGEAKCWKAEQLEAGLIPMKAAELETANEVALVLRRQIEILTQGLDYETEVVIAWQEETSFGTIWCRAMIDVWCQEIGLGMDLKSCASASERDVERAFANGYARQEAWYRRGLDKVFDLKGRGRFGFLFGEKDPPYLMREAASSEAFRHGAGHDCKVAILKFAECMKTGEWPGFDPFHVSPPSWLIHRWTAADTLDLIDGNSF